MESYLPEIALKQPKADPRTVLLHKRNFLESSSDHIQEESHDKMSFTIRPISATVTATTAECDRLQCQTLESRLKSQISCTLSAATSALVSLEAASSVAATSASSTIAATTTTTTSLHSTTLVNFYQSCHLSKFSSLYFVNDSLNNVYKFQKTKLLLVLLFICCAISSPYLPTTEAIPVRRTTASGQRLILHSNVYRERYHQNLLQDQRHHQQQQQQQQQQEQVLQKHHQHHQRQRPQQQKQQQEVQRPSSYLAPILRKVHHQQHHHLHQRAAPTAITINQQKMSYCGNNAVFQNLDLQMNSSLPYIKQLCSRFLQSRENQTYDEMKETWKLLKLEIRNPTRKPVTLDNELHQKMHDFYLNLHNFHQLAELVHQDTIDNKSSIEHSEVITAKIILDFFEKLKTEIKNNMGEAEKVLQLLTIPIPNLDENNVEFNRARTGRLRDFLVIKEFIEEMETISEVIKTICQSNSNGNGQ